MMKKVVAGGEISNEMFNVGETKVFFKAGILAKMEDLRDEKISGIMKGLQAQIRWNFMLVPYRNGTSE